MHSGDNNRAFRTADLLFGGAQMVQPLRAAKAQVLGETRRKHVFGCNGCLTTLAVPLDYQAHALSNLEIGVDDFVS